MWRSLVTGFLIFLQQIISSGRAFPQPVEICTTICFKHCSWSRPFLCKILMKSGTIKQDGLWAGLGYLEATLLGKVKNLGDSSAMNLLPTLARENLGSWWPSAVAGEERMLLLLCSIEHWCVTDQYAANQTYTGVHNVPQPEGTRVTLLFTDGWCTDCLRHSH